MTSVAPIPLRLLPDTARVESDGELSIGGIRLTDLAAEYGTPLFVYDEQHLRNRCREARAAFPGGVAYAGKAFLCGAMVRLVEEEGLSLDVATGGELHVALHAGFPPGRLVMHGNNKSRDELAMALDTGVGRIVVDSFDEMDRIEHLVAEGREVPDVLLRLTPGVKAETHEFISTGQDDSKFGFTVSTGLATAAVERAQASPHMNLVGLHSHIGSQVFEVESLARAFEVVARFAAPLNLEELSIGGGLGVAYVESEEAPTLTELGEAVAEVARTTGITSRVTIEPGRSIAARAAVTLYTVGTIKELPGIRTYLAVDGGFGDNPRPVLYGSDYTAFLPRAAASERPETVRLVGKHCESGDVLVREASLPPGVVVGDIVATPVTGAYGHVMGNNYNMVLRPAVVFVSDGESRLVVRRETLADLVARDLG